MDENVNTCKQIDIPRLELDPNIEMKSEYVVKEGIQIENNQIQESVVLPKFEELKACMQVNDKLGEFESLECEPDVPVLVHVKDEINDSEELEDEDLMNNDEDAEKIDYKIFREDVISNGDDSINASAHKMPKKYKKRKIKDIPLLKCKDCDYQCKRDYYLQRHLLKHLKPKEIINYTCTKCPYQTTTRQYFQQHLQVHKDPSKASIFSCTECTYKTTTKRYYRRHMLNHKEGAIVKSFKLDDFKTKDEEDAMVHSNPSDDNTPTNDECDSQSKVDVSPAQKDSSQTETFECKQCKFQTRYMGTLEKHMLRHEAPKVVTRLTCSECSYQTMDISNLRRHLQIHIVLPEDTMFKCADCNYKTNLKEYLQKHQRIHRDPTKATKYSCTECPFQTLNKSYFQKHMQLHKGATVYKCTKCDYECKLKEYLRKHLLKHNSEAEVKVFKCKKCRYQSKDRSNLTKHLRNKHKK